MRYKLLGALLVAGACIGCKEDASLTAHPAPAGTVTPRASGSVEGSRVTPARESGAGGDLDVNAAERSTLTHLAAPEPRPFTATCRDLAKSHNPPAQDLARVLRRLTCEPGLYFKPLASVEKELALPRGYELTFSGPATASLSFPNTITIDDLRHAMDIDQPVARMSNPGAWRHRIWYLGSDPKTGALDIWGPGDAMIRVPVEATDLPAQATVTTKLAGKELVTSASVTMPPSVVPVKHDQVAVKLLVTGLKTIAANRKLLSVAPEELAKQIGLHDERFRLSARSIGTTRSGTDIWAARTSIDADALTAALGLKGKIEHRRARDSDDYLLFDGSDSTHDYDGLHLELSFDRRGDRYQLSGIEIR